MLRGTYTKNGKRGVDGGRASGGVRERVKEGKWESEGKSEGG